MSKSNKLIGFINSKLKGSTQKKIDEMEYEEVNKDIMIKEIYELFDSITEDYEFRLSDKELFTYPNNGTVIISQEREYKDKKLSGIRRYPTDIRRMGPIFSSTTPISWWPYRRVKEFHEKREWVLAQIAKKLGYNS